MNQYVRGLLSCALLGVIGASAPAIAQERQAEQPVEHQQMLPTAEEVIDRHIEARGGYEAIEEKTTLSAKGTYETFDDGRTAVVEYRSATGLRQYMRVEFSGERLIAGCDGEERWRITPQFGAIILGPPTGRNKRNYDLHRDLRYHRYFPRLEVSGITLFDDRECYEVRLTGRAGREGLREYFDVKTGLKAGSRKSIALSDGLGDEIEVYRDWEDVDGVKMPMTQMTLVRTPGQASPKLLTRLRFETLEWNTLDDDSFEIPEGIRANAGRVIDEVDPEEIQRQLDESDSEG